jgi:hypothetical protein
LAVTDSMIGFCKNLFAVEIAVFGIIAAAIFVFIQVVYSHFSYREVGGILKNVFLVLYLIGNEFRAHVRLAHRRAVRERRPAAILIFATLAPSPCSGPP